MSERGSFVTQYVYCEVCFEGLQKVLCKNPSKWLAATALPSWDDNGPLSIIAGKVGGTWGGEERFKLDEELRLAIERAICHSVRISVLPEDDEADVVLVYEPRKRGIQTSA